MNKIFKMAGNLKDKIIWSRRVPVKGLRFFKAECHHKNYSLNPSSPDEIQAKNLGERPL